MADDGGIGRVQQRLAMIPKNVRAAMVPELVKSGNDLAVTARILAPRDTGALQESIAVLRVGRTPRRTLRLVGASRCLNWPSR